mgnify:CR=1 FL=1|tara:strand:- start:3100 stop:3573 length:474 start_codon:yes stop_codon:yes gene_type:complete
MKTKNIFLLFSTILLFSCSDPGGDLEYDGFELNFFNYTNKTYKAEIIIGGVINGDFVPTDSVIVNEINIGSRNSLSAFFDVNRWKPSLEKIRDLPSDRCYFKLKLSDGREELIFKSNSNDLMSLKLPKTPYFKGLFGILLITIEDNKIIGGASKEAQ